MNSSAPTAVAARSESTGILARSHPTRVFVITDTVMSSTVTNNNFLRETGDVLLLETGSKLLLQS